MVDQKEREIQADILSEFQADPFVVFCYPTVTGKTKMKGNAWTTLGIPGMPDIIGQLANGLMFGYEVKQPGEEPTNIQSEFMIMMIDGNAECGWGCSPLDAVKWLNEVKLRHIKPPKKQRKSSSPSRGTRLPEDWELPDEWYQWACKARPDVDANLEADKFKDYWLSKPGQGAIKLDWKRTWNNWIRNSSATKSYRGTINGTYQSANRESTGKEWLDQELF